MLFLRLCLLLLGVGFAAGRRRVEMWFCKIVHIIVCGGAGFGQVEDGLRRRSVAHALWGGRILN